MKDTEQKKLITASCETFILCLIGECSRARNSLVEIDDTLCFEYERARLLEDFFKLVHEEMRKTYSEIVQQVYLFKLIYDYYCIKGLDNEYLCIFKIAVKFKETNLIADTIRFILNAKTVDELNKKREVITEIYDM